MRKYLRIQRIIGHSTMMCMIFGRLKGYCMFLFSLTKWLSVCLRTKWLWVRVQLQSFIPEIPIFNNLFWLKMGITGMRIYQFLTIFLVKNRYYENEDLDLVILHLNMIPEYGLKHLYTISVHSYMIAEHFYTIPW